MPFFSFQYPVPSLPTYLFQADLVTTITPPQSFMLVPTITGGASLSWGKYYGTSDAYQDLYTEVYRSQDLTSWTLLNTLQWLNYSSYVDSGLLVEKVYYYKIRFVRKDPVSSAITSVSEYTPVTSMRAVTLLSFEPQDTYSNRFFQYLLSNLPGARIYDHTNAATFSADVHYWQTTCKITDPFKVMVDGSTVDEQQADPTALYNKRLINFSVQKKHVNVQGQDKITGAMGEYLPVSSYLIHTFLMGYAIQFLKLYEQYLNIVTKKYENYSQDYVKGFYPVVSTRIDPAMSDLYQNFGKLLNLEPPKAQTSPQAMDRYRSYLKSSFGNQNNTGTILGVNNAVENILGVTTETLLEYWKQHWFKTDRELKLYTQPADILTDEITGTDFFSMVYTSGYLWAVAAAAQPYLVRINVTSGQHTRFDFLLGEVGAAQIATDGGYIYIAISGKILKYHATTGARIAAFPTSTTSNFAIICALGSLYIATYGETGGGEVMVIMNPTTGTYTTYALPSFYACWDMVYDGGLYVWLCSDANTPNCSVGRFDATAHTFTNIPMAGLRYMEGIAYANGYVWLSTLSFPANLIKLDPGTLTHATFALTGYNNGETLRFDGFYLWMGLRLTTPTVLRIDPVLFPSTAPVSFVLGPDRPLDAGLEALCLSDSELWTAMYTITDPSTVYRLPLHQQKDRWLSTGQYPGSNISFTQTDSRFNTMVEIYANPAFISGETESLDVLGSSSDTPYTYLFRANISNGATPGTRTRDLFSTNPTVNAILSVYLSGHDAGATPMTGSLPATLVRLHTRYVSWENTRINLYGRKLLLSDVAPTITGEDVCTASYLITKQDPEYNYVSNKPLHVSPDNTGGTEDTNIAYLPNNTATGPSYHIITFPIVRDDFSEGVGYQNYLMPTYATYLYGEKRMLFVVGLTTANMQWLTKAYLKLFVLGSSAAGFLRLYRVKKKYDSGTVCWNYRKSQSVSVGSKYWDGTQYQTAASPINYVTADWETDGAEGSSDAVLLKEYYVDKFDSAGWVSMDITEVLQSLYKYETSHLDMGDDPENILQTGFMLTLEGFPNRSIFMVASDADATFKPKITWEKTAQGYYQCPSNATTFFYVDGTMRYGRLQVMSANREPISYVKTVNELIRKEDIRIDGTVSLSFSTAMPSEFVVGAKIYGDPISGNGAVGKITSVSGNSAFVSMELRYFSVGETVTLFPASTPSAVIGAISYTGNKYVKLSRVPVSTSFFRVYHTGVTTTPGTPPSEYPAYMQWSEADPGITPVFLNNVSGTLNPFVTQSSTYRDILYLNSTLAASDIGDVIITYQYMYDYYLMGKATTDSDSVSDLDGCSRVGKGLFSQTETDYLFRTELMLPMPSTGLMPDISGASISGEYSDHNLSLVASAVHNVRRFEAPVDLFKYHPTGRPYRFGQAYHSFFQRG